MAVGSVAGEMVVVVVSVVEEEEADEEGEEDEEENEDGEEAAAVAAAIRAHSNLCVVQSRRWHAAAQYRGPRHLLHRAVDAAPHTEHGGGGEVIGADEMRRVASAILELAAAVAEEFDMIHRGF